MFRHILVPVDLAETNQRALDFAVNLAILSQAKITLLHVIELINDTTFDDFAEFYTALQQQAESKLHKLMLPHRETTVVIDHQITFGNRTREILRAVESSGIDLIVLRSHQVDPAAPLEGWGSISHKIALMASCPVMLMK